MAAFPTTRQPIFQNATHDASPRVQPTKAEVGFCPQSRFRSRTRETRGRQGSGSNEKVSWVILRAPQRPRFPRRQHLIVSLFARFFNFYQPCVIVRIRETRHADTTGIHPTRHRHNPPTCRAGFSATYLANPGLFVLQQYVRGVEVARVPSFCEYHRFLAFVFQAVSPIG